MDFTRRRVAIRSTTAVAVSTALVALLAATANPVEARGPYASASALAAKAMADDDGEHPAPPQPPSPPSACTNTSGIPYATGLPALPCLPNVSGEATTRYQDNGAAFGNITTDVVKPKLTLALKAAIGRAFYTVCTGVPAAPCPLGFDVELPDPLYGGYFGVVATVYIQSPLGSEPQFGSFAPLDVGLYAFGAIPATARITITQARTAGTVKPLQLVWGSAGNVPPGVQFGGALARYGPAPTYPDGVNATLYPDAHVTGPVNVTVDHVVIDGQSLDVGQGCTSVLDLDLTAPGGWQPSNNTTPVRGQPGAYNPFFTPSYLTADVDIPAFRGCRSSTGENLDALVTGMVSGPHNRLDVTQLTGLTAFGCLERDADPSTCYDQHPPTVDPAKVNIP